jgi:hypothetical protein
MTQPDRRLTMIEYQITIKHLEDGSFAYGVKGLDGSEKDISILLSDLLDIIESIEADEIQDITIQ